jgi:hypothetical protein
MRLALVRSKQTVQAMKTVVKLVTLVFLLSSATAFALPIDQKAFTKTISSKHQNLFVFKVDRKFKKALIEVYYGNGDLVAITAMARRKMIINFCDMKSGSYTIKVKKNNRIEEFQFVKK